jgi:hypothetical protein
MATPVRFLPLRRKATFPRGSSGLRRALAWIGLGLGFAGLAGYVVWNQNAVDRAVRSLPARGLAVRQGRAPRRQAAAASSTRTGSTMALSPANWSLRWSW